MLSAPPRRRAGQRGLTLVELTITIAVIAIGASLSAPTFQQQLANYRVRVAAEGMVNALNQGRAEAVRRNTPVRFELSGSTSPGWQLTQVAGGATLASRGSGDMPAIVAASSSSSRTVTFLPTGQVDNSGTRLSRITVSSSSAGAESRQIDILGGGLIRQCQPGITAANDPRRC
jgi:type IV fimbrial biogenesis protein FimT